MQATYVSQEIYSVENKFLTEQISAISRLVYIGMGVLLAFQVVGLVVFKLIVDSVAK